MKNTLLIASIALSMFFQAFLHASETQREFEDWLPRMKEIFGEDQPTTSDISNVEVRELKYPGQRFQHMARTDIDGEGKSRKKIWNFWPTETRFHFQHETSFILLEEITSTEEEIDKGIIKSKYTVQIFNERLKSAKGGMDFELFSSEDLLKYLKEIGEEHGDKIKNAAKGMIVFGLSELFLIPEPTVTKIDALKSLAGGAALMSSWFALEKVKSNVDEDGNVIFSKKQVEEFFPECSAVIAKLRNLEGTEVLTTWKPEKGYTQFDINDIPNLSHEDKEMVAKMIFRFNPVGVKSVLPDDKKKDNVWRIDVKKVLGSVLTTAGIDYDSLDGYIAVKDCGVGKGHFEDETFLTKQSETDITTLKTVDAVDNTISFIKTFKDKSQLKMNARPKDGAIVVVTPQKGHSGPRYVKKVDMDAKILNHIDKPEGLLKNIDFEENTVRIHIIYTQIREQ